MDLISQMGDHFSPCCLLQGDLEKTHLHLEPIDMMNRDKMSQLPSMQVDFVDQICAPVYRCMSGLSGALAALAEGCERNRREWLREAEEQRRRDRAAPRRD